MKHIPILKPRRLSRGDTLGIIAPASPGSQEMADAGKRWLESQGFAVQFGKHTAARQGYLAGTDEARAADLHNMFASPDIQGIICLRGGYGTMRLLDLLDYDLISANPKVFVGYSDITALHTSIGQRTGLVSFHGPMLESDLAKDLPAYTSECFLQALTGTEPLGLIGNPPQTHSASFIVPGTAEGRLTGGNLSLIAATMGTPYEIDTVGKILCLEDVGEAPYRIDRMLTQLLLAGKLQAAAGIVVDVFAGCNDEGGNSNVTVEDVLLDRLGNLDKPVLMNLHFGHTADKATLPFGIKARLGTTDGGLVITETATADWD